jgi:hypothetical protein
MGGDVIRLSAEARVYWQEVSDLAYAFQRLPNGPEALKGFMGKLEGNFARLLLTFHIVESVESIRLLGVILPEIGSHTAKRARDLMLNFFVPSAVRIYGNIFARQEGVVQRVARFILSEKRERITERDLQVGIWAMRGSEHAGDRHQAIDGLVEAGWLAPFGGGWRVNPNIYPRFAKAEAEEQARTAKAQREQADAMAVIRRTYPEAA